MEKREMIKLIVLAALVVAAVVTIGYWAAVLQSPSLAWN